MQNGRVSVLVVGIVAKLRIISEHNDSEQDPTSQKRQKQMDGVILINIIKSHYLLYFLLE